jgi:hypothetical protein
MNAASVSALLLFLMELFRQLFSISSTVKASKDLVEWLMMVLSTIYRRSLYEVYDVLYTV